MKNILIVTCLFMLSILLASCGDNIDRNVDLPKIELENEISILVPSGPPYLAVAGALASEKVKINVSNGQTMLPAALTSGSYDIVIAPINAGASLYINGKTKFQVSHILTLNNTYIVSREDVKLTSILDLEEKEIVAFGEAGVPGKLLKKVYTLNNLDVNNISFKFNSSSDVYSAFAGKPNNYNYVLMSEPDITQLVVKENIKINKLDLSKVLGVDIVQAAVFVNPNSDNEDINKVLNLISKLVDYLNIYPGLYAEKIMKLDQYEVFNAYGKEVIEKSIPTSNIIFKEAKLHKELIINTLNRLDVNGELKDEFYR